MEFSLQNFEDISKTLDGSQATLVAEGKLFVPRSKYEPLRKGLETRKSNRIRLPENASGQSARVLRRIVLSGNARNVQSEKESFRRVGKIIWCKGNELCTSYSRTFTIHNYGYGTAYTFTHNNITLEHTAMNDKNTITHTDAYKHAVLSTLRTAR